MCLAIPGRVLSVEGEGDPLYRYGEIDFSGIRKRVSLGLVPEANVGDCVLVHVGLALQVIDEDEAKKILEYIGLLGDMEEELQEGGKE